MIKEETIKKYWLLIIPAFLISILYLVFKIIPEIKEFDEELNLGLVKESDIELFIYNCLLLCLIHLWEPALNKNRKDLIITGSLILLITGLQILAYNLPYVNDNKSNFFILHVLFLVFNSNSILLIVRSLLLKKKDNLFILFLIGLSLGLFLDRTYLLPHKITQSISPYNYLFRNFDTFIYKYSQIILYFVTLVMFQYYVQFFKKYSFKNLLSHFKEPTKLNPIEKNRFIGNFILNYTIVIFSLIYLKQYFYYFSFDFYSVLNLSLDLMYIFPLVVSGLILLIISVNWLHQNNRRLSWALIVLFIPIVNIIALIILSSDRKNQNHLHEIQKDPIRHKYQHKDKIYRFKTTLIAFYLLYTLIVVFAKVFSRTMSTHTNLYIWLILSNIIQLALFSYYTREKKAIYFLILNIINMAIINIVINPEYLGSYVSSILISTLWYLILCKGFHQPTINFDRFIVAKKEKD